MEHVEKNESMETTIKDLGNKMEEALLQDRKNDENKMPGILRFKMLNKIENTLRKTEQWQEEFLSNEGCQRLGDWMKQMPDGTYPNPKIVMTILGCIDRLPITSEYIEECDIEQILNIYKESVPGAGYLQCGQAARNILNKWYRQKNAIQTAYDADGRFDYGYKKLQRQLERERQESDEENERHGTKRIVDPQANAPKSFNEFAYFSKQSGFTKRPDFDQELRRRCINP